VLLPVKASMDATGLATVGVEDDPAGAASSLVPHAASETDSAAAAARPPTMRLVRVFVVNMRFAASRWSAYECFVIGRSEPDGKQIGLVSPRRCRRRLPQQGPALRWFGNTVVFAAQVIGPAQQREDAAARQAGRRFPGMGRSIRCRQLDDWMGLIGALQNRN